MTPHGALSPDTSPLGPPHLGRSGAWCLVGREGRSARASLASPALVRLPPPIFHAHARFTWRKAVRLYYCMSMCVCVCVCVCVSESLVKV